MTAQTAQFVKNRPLPVEGSSGAFEAGRLTGTRAKGAVTVEDAVFILARFENGVLGSLGGFSLCSRQQELQHPEIYGSKGSITFDLERMNELNFSRTKTPSTSRVFAKFS